MCFTCFCLQLKLISATSEAAELHSASALMTGKYGNSEDGTITLPKGITLPADSSSDESSAPSDLSSSENEGGPVKRARAIPSQVDDIAVPYTALRSKEIIAVPLDVDVITSDDYDSDEHSAAPTAAALTSSAPANTPDRHHHHVASSGLWDQAPSASLLSHPPDAEKDVSLELPEGLLVDVLDAPDAPVTVLQADTAAVGAIRPPLTELAVYDRVGMSHASDSVGMGDTFVTFKSFLAAVTASGLVCEVCMCALLYLKFDGRKRTSEQREQQWAVLQAAADHNGALVMVFLRAAALDLETHSDIVIFNRLL